MTATWGRSQAVRGILLRKGVGALLLFLTACGQSASERNEAAQQERLRAVAAAEQALAVFAKRMTAVPMPFSQFDLESKFTADVQNEFEGTAVVFRSGLVDVVRRSPDNFELIFGDPLGLDGSVVVLRSNGAAFGRLAAEQRDALRSYLVAARIDRIVPR